MSNPAEHESERTAGPRPAFLTDPTPAFGKPLCRLGLASRGRPASSITPDDVIHAIDRGINFLNWPGEADEPGGPDAMSDAIATMGTRRESVVVSVQFGARTARDAATELRSILRTLRTDYIDVLTFYYVEKAGGVAFLDRARRGFRVLPGGETGRDHPVPGDHESPAAAGRRDRSRRTARRADDPLQRRPPRRRREIFPVTDAIGMPVIAYTALRWGALLQPTPDDPPGFRVPTAPDWYRFVLQSPSVAVVLAAPASRAELDEDLGLFEAAGPLSPSEYTRLAEHGERVRRHAGRFP